MTKRGYVGEMASDRITWLSSSTITEGNNYINYIYVYIVGYNFYNLEHVYFFIRNPWVKPWNWGF